MEETISRSTAAENFNMLVLTIFGDLWADGVLSNRRTDPASRSPSA
jgi:hypothetical protein